MIRSNILSLSLCFLVLIPCYAQEADAPDPEVQKELALLQDGTRPAEYRLQTVNRLIREGKPGAIEGLRELLQAESSPPDLKLLIITGVLYHDSGQVLLDDALLVTATATDETFLEQVRTKVHWARSPVLVKALAARAGDRAKDAPSRLVSIDLLGSSKAKEAVDALISLWEVGLEPFGAAARAALDQVLPLHFHSAAEAREFWDSNSTKARETILDEALRKTGNGDGTGTGTQKQLLIKLAKSVLPDVSLARIVEQYLGCREVFELRRMGAERLGSYPYAELAAAEAEGRKAAAAGLMAALEAEDVPEVEVALLISARALTAELRAAAADRIRELCLARLNSDSPEVRLAAVQAAGELKDQQAVDVLTARYDRLTDQENDLRLAILDAVELSGNGNSVWVHQKLKDGEPDEDVVLRLIPILKKYKDKPDSDPIAFVPTLVEILRDRSRSARVRREAVIAIGLIGVPVGNKEAIDALAISGLADEDPSVRDIAASQLGRAPAVDGKVVEMLRARLGEVEKEERVRLSAARSLLNLRRAAAVPYLKSHLGDDGFWQETVRSFLARNLLGAGDAAGSAELVRVLCTEGLPARCVEAARLVLENSDLKWEGKAEGGREATAYFLARALEATGKDAEGLKVLTESVPETLPFDPRGVERTLLHAVLLRKTGAPEQVAATLERLASLENPPEGLSARVAIESALALLALGKPADAEKILKPHAADTTHGKRVQEVLAMAESAAATAPPPPVAPQPEELVAILDGPRDEKRTAAGASLKKFGKKAYPALLKWITAKKPEEIPASLAILKVITGITVPYDPMAPEAERQKALADLRQTLGGRQ